MRLAGVQGRATLVTSTGPEVAGIDVETASAGRFGADLQAIYPRWSEFLEWANSAAHGPGQPIDISALTSPVPQPGQVFAIGVNYAEHRAEIGAPATDRGAVPSTFTKFPSSLTGPFGELKLSSAFVDWEIELVVVIGRRAVAVSAVDAAAYVAGFAVGQDFSDRQTQLVGTPPQFSLGKSYEGYGPIGPWLTTPDELAGERDLELICEINGDRVQQGRTAQMIWSVPELIESLSAVCPLEPGDVIFSGTPSGVGIGRTPPRYLNDGDVVLSRIEGLGDIRQTCRAKPIAHSRPQSDETVDAVND
jgi:2-keto-4-pentenoate hydratase/2-oxohepta-3-ene-1,7-dioic acid hydratase in catechol pathway